MAAQKKKEQTTKDVQKEAIPKKVTDSVLKEPEKVQSGFNLDNKITKIKLLYLSLSC